VSYVGLLKYNRLLAKGDFTETDGEHIFILCVYRRVEFVKRLVHLINISGALNQIFCYVIISGFVKLWGKLQ